jgi:hypothetical protein
MALLVALSGSACGLGGDEGGLIGGGSGGTLVTADALADVRIVPSLPPRVGSVQAVPSIVTVSQGNVAIFTAVALDTVGRYLDNADFRWRIRDPRAGSMSVGGVFTAGSQPGVFRDAIEVTAVQTVGDREFTSQGTASVVVVSVGPAGESLTSVALFPSVSDVRPGSQVLFQAIALSGTGGYVQGVDLRWRVTDARAGTIESNGIFLAGDNPGIYQDAIEVQARKLGGVEAPVIARASVTVLSAEDLLAGGVRAVIAPEPIVGLPGYERRLLALAYDFQGFPVPVDQVIWRVTNDAAGAVDNKGLFTTGHTPGEYQDVVQATVVLGGDFAGTTIPTTASVVVQRADASERPPLKGQRTLVVPDVIRLRQGETQRISLLNFDLNGNSLETDDVRWVAIPEVARVDNLGRVTAIGEPGIYSEAVQVSVRDATTDESSPRRATATVVILGPLTRVEVIPSSITLEPGGSALFQASAFDEAGSRLSDVSFVWEILDEDAGRITAGGLLIAGDNSGSYPAAVRVRAFQRIRD